MILLLVGCSYTSNADNGHKELVAVNAAVKAYGKMEAEKYGMKLLFVYNVSGKGVEPYSMSITSNKQMNLEEGQKFARAFVSDFYTMLQQCEEAKQYVVWGKRYVPSYDKTPYFDTLCVKIGFWDENIDRIKPPYLAEILFVDGAFHYYKADPVTGKLHEEIFKSLCGSGL